MTSLFAFFLDLLGMFVTFYILYIFSFSIYEIFRKDSKHTHRARPLRPVLTPNFKSSQATLPQMVEYWREFSQYTQQVAPEVVPDLKAIGAELVMLHDKSQREKWTQYSSPAQIAEIATIIYQNYPNFIYEYEQLPKALAQQKNPKGQSARDIIVESSHILQSRVTQLAQEVFMENLKNIQIEQKVVRDKYNKSEI